jgi:A/G-specific adenine glycosylase
MGKSQDLNLHNNSLANNSLYIAEDEIKIIRHRILRWGRINFRDFPWRTTGKLWHKLAAEILLQRTKAKSAASIYNQFINKFSDPSELASAPLEELQELVYPLGLPVRASQLKNFGIALMSIGGNPPDSIEELLNLPAIGQYAAAAYLSFHRNKRAVIIDANVVRWICRLIDNECNGETRRKKWMIDLADKLTPNRSVKDYNYAVLDFTMEICTTNPKCEICPIGPELCLFGRRKLNK